MDRAKLFKSLAGIASKFQKLYTKKQTYLIRGWLFKNHETYHKQSNYPTVDRRICIEIMTIYDYNVTMSVHELKIL